MYKLSTTLCYRLFLESNEFTSTHIDFATLLMRELIRITYWDYIIYLFISLIFVSYYCLSILHKTFQF